MAKQIYGFEEKFLSELKEMFKNSRIEEIELEEEELYLRISKHGEEHFHNVVNYVSPSSGNILEKDPLYVDIATKKEEKILENNPADTFDETKHYKVKSPLVGTFYEAPSPNSPPFVKLGDSVLPDTTLCIIEAMKVMNEIKAEVKGKIVKILKTNASPVKADEEIFIIEKM